jgi:hypothetical protein
MPPIYVREIVADGFFYMHALFEYFYFATITAAFDFGDHRIASLDPHVPVGCLIELFHSSFPKQRLEVM